MTALSQGLPQIVIVLQKITEIGAYESRMETTMSNDNNIEKTEALVERILDSYQKYDITCKLDADNNLSQQTLIEVLEKIREVLFPGFLDPTRIRTEYIKYIVGEHIEFIQYHLKKQVAKALGKLDSCGSCQRSTYNGKADEIVNEFLNRLPEIRDMLYMDVQAAYNGDPAAYSMDEIIFSYPGLYAITVYRIAHELWTLQVPLIPRIMTEHAHSKTGIDIHPGATIGKYFFIDHGTGIVIGETTVIGDNVKIYQGVTLGGLSTRKGQALRGSKRHPTIGDNVTIYSNSSILGGDTVIGDGATIGGNAFIVKSVPAGTRVNIRDPQLEFSSYGMKYNEFVNEKR